MVSMCDGWMDWRTIFQYSLCRVVLMVALQRPSCLPGHSLSVLALSSRFDGLRSQREAEADRTSFSTRSVESF